MTWMGILVGLVLGGTQAALNLFPAAFLPFALAGLFFISLLIYFKTGLLVPHANFQFAVLLFLPIVNQWALGGFAAGGGIMLWGIAGPFGALMFLGIKRASVHFLLYMVGLLFALLAERYLPAPWPRAPEQVSFWSLLFNSIGFAAFVYVNVLHFVRGKEEAMDALDHEHALLKAEREKSERLLLNILPEPIAERLKREDRHIAEGYSGVTVLFADIVNFTELAGDIEPDELVAMLNLVFSRFDKLADAHGLEKIKTIGDAYMAAGGLPVQRDDHAEICAEMALDMLAAMREFAPAGGRRLRVRIGMNSGPVVAGVIGTRKFIYDLWGDAVNTASRMESSGHADAIQVTHECRELLKDKFEFEERGEIEVKGKGLMRTYFLRGRKAS